MIDRKLINECVHCGFCLPTCPTYLSWREEMDSPRGRIYLMKSLTDGAALSTTMMQHFDRCLGCMACVTACPSGVKYDTLNFQTRAEVEQAGKRSIGDRLFRSMIFSLFPHPKRLKAAQLLQLLYTKSGLQWLVRHIGILRILPRRLENLEALMPPVSMHQVTAKLPEFSGARGPHRARVALLAGCVQRAYFPEVNEATVRVLNAEGCDVVVPQGLGCCGALSAHAGRADEARRFMRAAIAELEAANVDAVIVNAAGCGSVMKEWQHLFHRDREWAKRAEAISAKVRDISEYLVQLGPVAQRNPLHVKAAYHDACHLAHAQRIRSEPRALLAQIPGIELSDVPDAELCCGSAGIYNLVEPESARQIGSRKVDNILSVSPELLVSANPGCTLQISKMLRERGASLPMAHVIEVLDASIRGASLTPPAALLPERTTLPR